MYSFTPKDLEYIKNHLDQIRETFLWYHHLEGNVVVPVDDLEDFVLAVHHNE